MDGRPYVHDYREFNEYKKVKDWYDGFEPEPDRDYGLAHDLATRNWDEVKSTIGIVEAWANGTRIREWSLIDHSRLSQRPTFRPATGWTQARRGSVVMA